MEVITTRKRCPKRGCKGELVGTGSAMSNSIGTVYDHRCTICEHKSYLDKFYPSQVIKYNKSELEERWEK